MKTKLIKTYIYTGLGFPIELNNVELVYLNGEYFPKIDVRAVADDAIKIIILQNSRFTGDQIKFVRTYFSMSLREFGRAFNESHTAVNKWEHHKDEPTGMDSNIEMSIRLYIYDKIFIKNNKDKIKFYDHYHSMIRTFYNRENKKSYIEASHSR